MTRTRYKIHDTAYPHFLTCTVVGWVPVFTRMETVEIVLDSWRFLQDNDRLTLFGYVILENHLHWIASAEDLARQIGEFKSFTARGIIDLLEARNVKPLLRQFEHLKARHKTDSAHQFWQEGSHPQMIESDEMMRQKLEYIHNNPVVRGFVDDPTHWRYSSARNYAGQTGLIPVTTEW
ncbi:MAG: transposase [Planctomycetes bacterium]|nr:transposase [Planctomycetota bacterium]MCG2682040.1 transposase [Planctomycetales bacterium]